MIFDLLKPLGWIVSLEFVHFDDVVELIMQNRLQTLIIQASGRGSRLLLLLGLLVTGLRVLLPRLRLRLIALLGRGLRVAGRLIALLRVTGLLVAGWLVALLRLLEALLGLLVLLR